VPLFDTSSPLAPLEGEIKEAVLAVLEGGRFILGPNVSAFEREFASYLGVREVVGVANGTEALTVALRALGVGSGDEVVVPSFTFFATAEAVVAAGARPVFCDIDLETFCVTAETVRRALTPRTKAVIAVHLFGNLAPVAEIEALGLPVVEDAAQAAGSYGPGGKAGALGAIAAFSFFPSKNLPCMGDGGAIATDDPALAERARLLRNHGSVDKRAHHLCGYNSRLDELQAAVLRVLLPHLDGWAQGRQRVGERYRESAIGDLVSLPTPAAGARPAWHLYVIRSSEAEPLRGHLEGVGVECRPYYRTPIHRQPAMADYGPFPQLPATEEAAASNLALPMAPTLTDADVAEVERGVLSFFEPVRERNLGAV